MSIDKLKFKPICSNLLISDEDLEEYKELTIGQLARIYGCHENLIQLRLIHHQVQVVQC